jgi:hypothetical protein
MKMRTEAEIKRAIELCEQALKMAGGGNGAGHVQACLSGIRWTLGENNREVQSVEAMLSRFERMLPMVLSE